MADLQKLPGSGNNAPADLVTGPQAAPLRLIGIAPKTQAAPLPAGSHHLVLPEWTRKEGPTTFQITGDSGGTQLSGMGVAADIVEYPILAVIISLLNIGVTNIVTQANNSGSPNGMRFSQAVNIEPGTAAQFICAEVAGVTIWYPLAYSAVG